MKRIAMAFALGLLATAPGIPAASSPAVAPSAPPVLPSEVSATGEDLFKWGEYDSLIRMLEPATHDGALANLRTENDSAARAKSFLFLGVAFFATGKAAMADNAFQQACALDPAVKLDRFYVTEEIANHFQAIALDGIRRRSRMPAASSAGSLADAPNPRKAASPAKTGDAQMKAGNGKSWLWWSLGVTAAAVAGGGAYYFASRDPAPAEDHVTVIDLKK